MHPWFMKFLAIAFAGGSAVLLACTVHDDTSFPNPPQPTRTTSPDAHRRLRFRRGDPAG